MGKRFEQIDSKLEEHDTEFTFLRHELKDHRERLEKMERMERKQIDLPQNKKFNILYTY